MAIMTYAFYISAARRQSCSWRERRETIIVAKMTNQLEESAASGLTVNLVGIAGAPREVTRRLTRDAEDNLFDLIGCDAMALAKMTDVVFVPEERVDPERHASSFHCSGLYYGMPES